MFPPELVMDSLRVRGLATDSVSCALICSSETDLETESAKLSSVSAKFRAMEWVLLSFSGAYVPESVLAPGRKLF